MATRQARTPQHIQRHLGPKRWLASGKTPGPLAEGLKPQAKRLYAANRRQKIGPRLTGLAWQRTTQSSTPTNQAPLGAEKVAFLWKDIRPLG
jgi:hypothetical protein